MLSGEQLLKQAFSEVAAIKYEQVPEYRHIFSLRYRIRKHKLLRSLERKTAPEPRAHTGRFRLKYLVLAVIMACVLVLAGFTCYYIINGFSFKVYKDHSVVEYLDIESGKTSIEEEFYLPETNEIIVENEYLASTWRIIQYNYNTHNLVFHQNTVDSSLNINTENRIVELTYVGDCKAFYIEQGEELILCWFQDGYIFTITGSLDKETAIELAKTARIR